MLIKDRSTVTPQGERKWVLIEGVVVRPTVTQVDERGSIAEVYNPTWGVSDLPMVYTYTASIRPGKVKGWQMHKLQFDRVFPIVGFMKWVLWDSREDSPTYGMINEVYMSEQNRNLVIIPPFVFHAVQNVGLMDAYFVNNPTMPYNHNDPDKYRLPLENDLIDYHFSAKLGW